MVLLFRKGLADLIEMVYKPTGDAESSPLGGFVIEHTEPRIDLKGIVRAGYDACAVTYAAARATDDADQLRPLLDVLPKGSAVLDLGCGAGLPIARALSERYCVTGVDISQAMVRLAAANVPEARFLRGDVLDVALEEASFDAAVAIFMLFHVPCEEHGRLFERVWSWLRPGGHFLVTLTQAGNPARVRHDFFGTDMYWSSPAFEESIELLTKVGFEIVRDCIIGHRYGRTIVERDERNPMTLVRKPLSANG